MIVPVVAAIVSTVASGVAVHTPKKLKNIGTAKKAWLDSFTAAAKPICKANGVPYQMCVAQAALESGWGAHAPGFNHFGIKGSGSAGSLLLAGHEFIGGKKIAKKMSFAAYKTLDDAIQGYCHAMKNNPRFKYATEAFPDNFEKFTTWIWGNGYATAPDYVYTLIGVASVIYRATGNEDFNIKPSSGLSSIIKKLQSVEKSKRVAMTSELLREDA